MPLTRRSCAGSSWATTGTDTIAAPPGSYSLLGISSHCLSLFFPVAEEVCKPFSFEQYRLNIEADFLYIDAGFLFLLVVSGSSQANCLRTFFIAACDNKERKYANTLSTQEEKRQVRLWERQQLPRGSSPARRSSTARRAGHQPCRWHAGLGRGQACRAFQEKRGFPSCKELIYCGKRQWGDIGEPQTLLVSLLGLHPSSPPAVGTRVRHNQRQDSVNTSCSQLGMVPDIISDSKKRNAYSLHLRKAALG